MKLFGFSAKHVCMSYIFSKSSRTCLLMFVTHCMLKKKNTLQNNLVNCTCKCKNEVAHRLVVGLVLKNNSYLPSKFFKQLPAKQDTKATEHYMTVASFQRRQFIRLPFIIHTGISKLIQSKCLTIQW